MKWSVWLQAVIQTDMDNRGKEILLHIIKDLNRNNLIKKKKEIFLITTEVTKVSR